MIAWRSCAIDAHAGRHWSHESVNQKLGIA